MAVDHIKDGLAPAVAFYLRKCGFSSTLSAFLKENGPLGNAEEEIDLEAIYKAYASTLETGTTRERKKRKNTQDESSKRENDGIESATVKEVQMELKNRTQKKSKKLKVSEIDDIKKEPKEFIETNGAEEATNGPNKVAKKSKKLKDIVNGIQDASEAKEIENMSKDNDEISKCEERDQEVRKIGRKRNSNKEKANGMEEVLTEGEKDPKIKSMKEIENEPRGLVAASLEGEAKKKSKKKLKDVENDKKNKAVVFENPTSPCKKDKKVKNPKKDQVNGTLKPQEDENATSKTAGIPSEIDNAKTYEVEQEEGSKNKSKMNKSKKHKANEDVFVDSDKVNRLQSGSDEKRLVSEQNTGKEFDDYVQVMKNSKKKGADNGIQEALRADEKNPTKEIDTSVEMEHSDKAQSGTRKKKNQPSGALAFKRVDAEKVEFADPRLCDNSYWAKNGAEVGYGAKAQEILGQVRGRGFRHEKTKKKRGSYRGGLIGLESHSIKFQNSDDED